MLGGISLSTIASIVLILLRIADKLSDKLQAERYKNEGYEKAKAEAAANLLRKSQYAKAIQDHVGGMSDSDVDGGLRELEPSEPIPADGTKSPSGPDK